MIRTPFSAVEQFMTHCIKVCVQTYFCINAESSDDGLGEVLYRQCIAMLHISTAADLSAQSIECGPTIFEEDGNQARKTHIEVQGQSR